MRGWVATASMLVALQHAAYAAMPADFEGRWTVVRMVGASEVGTGDDYHKLLGTTVDWGSDMVSDADGACRIVHATVAPMSNDTLQHDVWGGQTIAGLALPKTLAARAFGRTETPVFDDGGKGCARAVMLDAHQLLLPFGNGYVYLLNRVVEPAQGNGSR